MSNLTFIHNDLYGTSLNIAKKFVSKSQSRPILQYCFLRFDGSLFATNSQYALRIKDIHGFKEDLLINPFNNMQAKGNYPDMEKVIENVVVNPVIQLDKENLNLWYQIFKSVNQILKTYKTRLTEVEIEIKENSLIIYYLSKKVKMEVPINTSPENVGKKLAFQSEFMMNALEVHIKLESKTVNFCCGTRNNPFTLDSEKARVLILPIRKSEED